jgi:S-adenosylmethionine:tRNA ribosyltransferase-isomerase
MRQKKKAPVREPSFLSLVPGGGIEPPLCYQNWILSPARLPIPPSRRLRDSPRIRSPAKLPSPDEGRIIAEKPCCFKRGAAAIIYMAPSEPYRLSDFDFVLPPELIAQRPVAVRSSSRLLHVGETGLVDRRFADLSDLLMPGDVAVFNDTRVVRSRLYGHKATGGKVELMLERLLPGGEAWMQCRASHAPPVGMRIDLANSASATVLARDGRFVRLRFDAQQGLAEYLERYGEVPLPPYITRSADAVDAERYQTVYAQHPGAVAAPTAGLHFDQPALDRLRTRGVEFAYVTLHVGAGTFQPVDNDDLSQHRMHVESFSIPTATVRIIEAALSRSSRIMAVGTTSLRALESAANASGQLRAGDAETRLFITPGYRFRIVDRLLTNFHLPRSTLLMLVSAFAGYDRIRAAYTHAVAERYRFFSYGDAMLLERAELNSRP